MLQFLKNTVLMDDKLIAYCHVSDGSFTYMGPDFADGPSWKSAFSGCAFLASHLDGENHIEDRAIAIFLVAKFVSQSRYNKLIFQIAMHDLTPQVHLPPTEINNIYEIAEKAEKANWLRNTQIYSGSDYLLRFNAGGKFYIVFVFAVQCISKPVASRN